MESMSAPYTSFFAMHVRRPSRPAKAYSSVVSFLQRTYWSVAETLLHELDIQPDQFGKKQDTRTYRQQLKYYSA